MRNLEIFMTFFQCSFILIEEQFCKKRDRHPKQTHNFKMVASGLLDTSYKGQYRRIKKVIRTKVTDIEAVGERIVFHAQF